VADAEVKALGSRSPEVQTGSTDPRGVYEVSGISGTSAVVVKQGDNRYAFHRGTVELGAAPEQTPANGVTAPAAVTKPKGNILEKGEYLKNINESNKAVQEQQLQNWDMKRRGNSKGVEAKDVFKK
jgi:hypothetical protein